MIFLQLPRTASRIQTAFIVSVGAVCILELFVGIAICASSDRLQGGAVCGLFRTYSEDRHIMNGSESSSSSGSGVLVSEILIYWISRGDLCKLYK